MTKYPKDLVGIINKSCKRLKRHKFHRPPMVIPEIALARVLEVAYQASFKTEEKRRPGFRIILYSPTDHKKYMQNRESMHKYYNNWFRLIPFESARRFTAAEINRLAPAAELTRLLVCVSCEEYESPVIWAMLDTGENWWKFIHHEVSGGMPPPNHLTITSMMPGELTVSAEGTVFATLKDGEISQPSMDSLWTGQVSDFLEPARHRLYEDAVSNLKSKKWDDDGNDNDFPHRFYTFFLERVLFYTRLRDHGGTILMIPEQITQDDTRILDRLNTKYSCTYQAAWNLLVRSLVNHRKFYDLHFPLWDGKKRISKELFQEHSMLKSEGQDIEEGLTDVAQAIAAMTAVDGAVVINRNFDVLGFGAEVIASSPSLSNVSVFSGNKKRGAIPIEAFGTRHRSAFRFCSSFEDAVAFVVSQDGGIKAVKRVAKDVALWPDINSGSMGI